MRTLVKPNLAEATRLSGVAGPADAGKIRLMARRLYRLGAKAVLITGGDMDGPTADDLFFDGGFERIFSAPRIKTRNSHGTGCALSSAIAAYLARGLALQEAISAAKSYLTGALEAADLLSVGGGRGPAHYFFELWARPPQDWRRLTSAPPLAT